MLASNLRSRGQRLGLGTGMEMGSGMSLHVDTTTRFMLHLFAKHKMRPIVTVVAWFVCVRASVRACMRACVRVCVSVGQNESEPC